MEATSRLEGIPVSELKAEVNNGPVEMRGTWVHEDIALEVARWLSPDFGAFMRKTFRRFIKGEITTEESKAAKKAMDSLLEDSRLKYEQSQKQLQAAQVDLKFSEGRRQEAEASSKKFWRQVDQATAETDDLKKQLGLKRQTAGKRKRTQEGKHFLQELSRVIMEHRDGVPGPWPEVEDKLEMSVPAFLDYLKSQTSSYGWVGQDLSKFGELPTKKGNPKQWNVMLADAEIGSCRYDNIVPARNHETRGKLWQAPADGMEDDD